MKTAIVQLSSLLEELGEEETTKLLHEFTCPLNLDVQRFLTQETKAIRFEQTGNARTYLILDDATGKILAYFAVTFKDLILAEKQISKTQIRKMNGISKSAERVSAFLIGQIGKNASVENNPITLQIILGEIYSVIAAAKALIGGRIVFLECENNESLIRLYQKHGFTLIGDDTSGLRTMYINIIEHPVTK